MVPSSSRREPKSEQNLFFIDSVLTNMGPEMLLPLLRTEESMDRGAPGCMDHTLGCAEENFLEVANLGSSKGFALGSHPNFALQLSHISSMRNTPRKVTMSQRLKKGPAIPTLAH